MEEEKSLGVWSTQNKSWIGTGTTRRKTTSKRLWDVRQLIDGTYKCTPLNSNMIAAGSPRILESASFHSEYTFEPDFVSGFGKSTRISKDTEAYTLRGEPNLSDEAPRLTGEVPASPPLRKRLSRKELQEKEHEVRADFGMGLTYLRMGRTEQAKALFDAIPDKDVPWEAEHKHMFSDFGTGLRKTRLHDSALKHYLKALELAPEDEHLCHNIARVYYEKEQIPACRRWLTRSLEINPDLAPSKQFLRFLDKQIK